MFPYEGKGILFPLIVVLSQGVTFFLFAMVQGSILYLRSFEFPFFLSLAVGCGVSAAWAHYIKDTYYYKEGKKVILHEVENSFCWISLAHWVHILNVAGIICFVEWVWP